MDRTTPRAALSIPHSLDIPGAAKLMDSTSKPSSAHRATVTATTTIWRRLMSVSDIMSRGSMRLLRIISTTVYFEAAPGSNSMGWPGGMGETSRVEIAEKRSSMSIL